MPSTSPETVFVIHHGQQDYLRIAAEYINKSGNRSILIGNCTDAGKLSDLYFDDGQISLPEYEAFERQYVHMSSATPEFELLCFKRYFYLYVIAKKLGLHHFWMIDSDLVLTTDLSETQKHPLLQNCIAAYSTPYQDEHTKASSPHCSYWTLEGLEQFLQFLGQLYQGNTRQLLNEKYAYHLEHKIPGGICDMTALFLWQKGNSNILNLASAHLNGLPLFDNNINHDGNAHPHEFEMIKRINLKRVGGSFPRLYAVKADNKSRLPIACLHFQGKAKAYMEHFMHNEAISYRAFAGIIARLYIDRRLKSLRKKLSFRSKSA